MKRVLIQPQRCINCLPCAIEVNCTMKAVIREGNENKPWIDFYLCSGCLKCKIFCPSGAVEEIVHPCNGKGRMGW